jgi:hypothetical protein
MNDRPVPPSVDPNDQFDENRDPEAPHLTDLDEPELESGTDIVPPDSAEPPDRREGVVCDPDSSPTSTRGKG